MQHVLDKILYHEAVIKISLHGPNNVVLLNILRLHVVHVVLGKWVL